MIAIMNAAAAVVDAQLDAQVAMAKAIAAKTPKMLSAFAEAIDEITRGVEASRLGEALRRAEKIQLEIAAAVAPHAEAIAEAGAPLQAATERLKAAWRKATGKADEDNSAPRDEDSDEEFEREVA